MEIPFPRGRGKVERSDFSQVCLLKGVDVSDETAGQQVQSEKGDPISPSTMGLHGSAPLAALPARAKMGTQKGYTRAWKGLCGAVTNQGAVIPHSSGILLILGCQKLCKSCPGRSPCSHAIGLHLAPSSSKNELMVWFSPDLLVPVVLLRF